SPDLFRHVRRHAHLGSEDRNHPPHFPRGKQAPPWSLVIQRQPPHRHEANAHPHRGLRSRAEGGMSKVEQKTERFNLFLSPSEREAIEQWAWDNRIRSLSEAVRQLIASGLAAKELEARLERRDTFICEKGLWPEFASTSLPKPSIEAQGEAA